MLNLENFLSGEVEFNLENLQKYIKNVEDINAKNNSGVTLLHYACEQKSSFELIKYLIDNKADLNAKDNNDVTPFMYFCSLYPFSCENFQYLVDNHADFKAIAKNNYSIAHIVCSNTSVSYEFIKYLVENKIDFNAVIEDDGDAPVHLLCSNPSVSDKIIKYLFDIHVDFELVNSKGMTPVENLMENPKVSFEIFKLLVENGKIDIIESSKETRRQINSLCENAHVTLENLQWLSEKIDLQKNSNTYGNISNIFSFVDCLCQNPSISLECIQYLIKCEVEFNNKKNDGKTALHYLCSNRSISLEIIQCLVENKIMNLYKKISLSNFFTDYRKDDTTYGHVLFKNPYLSPEIAKYLIENNRTNLTEIERRELILNKILKEEFFSDKEDLKLAIKLFKKPEVFSAEMSYTICSSFAINDDRILPRKRQYDYNLLQWLCLTCKNADAIECIAACYGENLYDVLKLEDSFGRNCLQLAVLNECSSLRVVKFLIDQGTLHDFQDNDKQTALHHACSNKNINLDIIEFLINKGCDLNQKDKIGKTPLDYISKENQFCVETIKDYAYEKQTLMSDNDNDKISTLRGFK